MSRRLKGVAWTIVGLIAAATVALMLVPSKIPVETGRVARGLWW